jgi:hypothetical protein
MIISPYASFTSEKPKEEVWESVRHRQFPELPSRHEAFFLFETEGDLQKASRKWWSGQTRQVLRAQIIHGALVHKADSNFLDSSQNEWEASAKAYWSSLETDEPIFEIVVQGCVYFPDWKTFPTL